MTAVVAELRKAITLPATWIAAAVAVLGCSALTLLNALAGRGAIASGSPEQFVFSTAFDTAYAATPLGTVAAVVIGVVTMSSEYTPTAVEAGGARQVSTTLLALPHRVGLLLAKAAAVTVLILAVAAVTIPLGAGLAHLVLAGTLTETTPVGEMLARSGGAAAYWSLMGLMALSVTVFSRSGLIPLVVFILNGSVVSLALLLTHLTPLAFWLPDLAGSRLFGGVTVVDGAPALVPGALAMAAWALALLGAATLAFTRRDA